MSIPKQKTKGTAKEKDDGGSYKTADELAADERERYEKEVVAAAGSGDRLLAAFRAPARSFHDIGRPSAQFPMVTPSNYTNRSPLMRVSAPLFFYELQASV
jgi:hypothetical protein